MEIKLIIDDEHLSQTAEICALAKRAGLHVERVIPEFGTIFGTGDAPLLEKLQSIEGVAQAVPEGRFQVPPLSGKTPL